MYVVKFGKKIQKYLKLKSIFSCFSARQKEAARPRDRVLDRNCSRMFQHREFQFPHGNHSGSQHIFDIAIKENRKLQL